MKSMKDNIIKVKVKKDGRTINVYKLEDGRYNIYLGEEINLQKVEAGKHTETFDKSELEFL